MPVTQKQLAAAFTEWERRFREEPARFKSEAERVLTETPETYGEACAPYLVEILREQGVPVQVDITITATQPDTSTLKAICETVVRALRSADDLFRPKGGYVPPQRNPEPKGRYATGGIVTPPVTLVGDRPGEVTIKPKRTRKPKAATTVTNNDEL